MQYRLITLCIINYDKNCTTMSIFELFIIVHLCMFALLFCDVVSVFLCVFFPYTRFDHVWYVACYISGLLLDN